jgi:hypothetical protein
MNTASDTPRSRPAGGTYSHLFDFSGCDDWGG